MLLHLVGRLNQPPSDPYPISESEARLVADNGLGPLFWTLAQQGHLGASVQSIELLQSADMTARVIAARSRNSLLQILEVLENAGLEPVVLKGADVAQRFYPEPHWRVMGDLDLLLRNDTGHEALKILEAEGFRNPTSHPDELWDGHHHVVPVYHPDLKQWVEIHHRLITDKSPFQEEAVFLEPALGQNVVTDDSGERPIRFLAPALTRLHTIAHWYFDLMDRWGDPGLQRPILDCLFMRRSGLSEDENRESQELVRACKLMGFLLDELEDEGPKPPLWWPLPGNIQQIHELKPGDSALRAELASAAFSEYLVSATRPGFQAKLLRAWVLVTVRALTQRITSRQRQRL